eukprot:Nitzschia sp. Nitz4//scaffold4_size323378//248665//250314//NITZ4_000698-RA/size323378-processed-gene-0.377-mRNA-1//-1//CDS//3329553513//3550//frame0
MKLATAATALTLPLLVQSDDDAPWQVARSRSKYMATHGGNDRHAGSGEKLQSIVIQEPQSIPVGLKPDSTLRNQRKYFRRPCDPTSSDADIGVLSCGFSYTCVPNQESSQGGLCMPEHSSLGFHFDASHKSGTARTGESVPCDPTLSEADVGILACGKDQFCKPSHTSALGGDCATRPSLSTANVPSRRLDNTGPFIGYCDPTDPTFGDADCDCNMFDLTSTEGEITCVAASGVCLSLLDDCTDDCCSETCYNQTETRSYGPSNVLWQSVCYAFYTPHDESFCLTVNFDWEKAANVHPADTCAATFNGQNCSCTIDDYTIIYYFDCTNVGGPEGNDYYGPQPVSQLPIVQACYAYPAATFPPTDPGIGCRLCPGGSVASSSFYSSVEIPGLGNYTCGQLSLATYIEHVFDDGGVCASVVEGAADGCCQDDSALFSQCDICSGSGFAYPEAYVVLGGAPVLSCSYGFWKGYFGMLDDSTCENFTGGASNCCTNTTNAPPPATAAPSMEPTATLTSSPTEGPTPSSSSAQEVVWTIFVGVASALAAVLVDI